jgi:hypothetical protein
MNLKPRWRQWRESNTCGCERPWLQGVPSAAQLFDLSLVQQTPGRSSASRWAFRGAALNNVERSFRGGGGLISFSPTFGSDTFNVENGDDSADDVVVRLLGYFTPGAEGIQELVATVPAGKSAVPQITFSDGSQSTFPTIPTGEVFRVFSLSVQPGTVGAAAAPADVRLTQAGASSAATTRWALTGGIRRNFEATFGMDVGIAFATPVTIQNGSDQAGNDVVVRLWGVLTPPDKPQIVELSATVAPGHAAVSPRLINPDGSSSTFDIPDGQAFLLNYVSVRRMSAKPAPALVDVSLNQSPPGVAAVSRWAYRGTTTENVERPFYPGVLFTTPFTVQSGPNRSDCDETRAVRPRLDPPAGPRPDD